MSRTIFSMRKQKLKQKIIQNFNKFKIQKRQHEIRKIVEKYCETLVFLNQKLFNLQRFPFLIEFSSRFLPDLPDILIKNIFKMKCFQQIDDDFDDEVLRNSTCTSRFMQGFGASTRSILFGNANDTNGEHRNLYVFPEKT